MFYKTITTLVIFALVPHFSFRIYLEKIKCAKAEKGHALLLGVQILAFVITMIVFFVLANGRSLSEIGLIPRSIAFSLTWLANPIGLLYVVGRFIYYGSFSFLIFSRAISFFLLITGSWVIFF